MALSIDRTRPVISPFYNRFRCRQQQCVLRSTRQRAEDRSPSLSHGGRSAGDHPNIGDADSGLLDGGVTVSFPGEPVEERWHRKLADLRPVPVPEDAEQLYEATCFSAPNDALEVQSLRRSGASQIPQVIAARQAFFEQELFWRRGIWDKYLFDGNDESFLGVYHYRRDQRVSGGCLRLDLGKVCEADTIRIKTLWEKGSEAEPPPEMAAEVASDLKSWRPVVLRRKMQNQDEKVKVAWIENNGGKQRAVSFPAVVFEYGPSKRAANNTCFFPITPEMRGKTMDVVVLGRVDCKPELKPEVWTTVYPNPYTSVEVLLD